MFAYHLYVLVVIFAATSAKVSKQWHGLSFDSPTFMCDKWNLYCETILDDLGCSSNTTQREMEGCLDFPEEKEMQNWVGKCNCMAPFEYTAGPRVATQLMVNRMGPDMYWILEPGRTGPVYDITGSYETVCGKLLDRLGCPEENTTIVAHDHHTSVTGDNFQCTCGTMTSASSFVNVLIMDRLNDFNQRSTPIFSNPVYLSVPVSMCILLITGKLGAIIAVYFKLPPIIGFLLTGYGIQNILSPMFLRGAGFPFPSPASELKLIARVIVLMRAGLAIKFDEIFANGLAMSLLTLVPYFAEFFAFLYVGKHFFHGFSTVTMGLFASITAPVGKTYF
jgi:hypothetical protein